MDFTALAQERGQPLRVFGNLPYNISTPLMFHLFTFTNAISDMNFMLQKKWLTVWLPVGQQNIRPSECHGTVLLPVVPVLDVPPTAFRPHQKWIQRLSV